MLLGDMMVADLAAGMQTVFAFFNISVTINSGGFRRVEPSALTQMTWVEIC